MDFLNIFKCNGFNLNIKYFVVNSLKFSCFQFQCFSTNSRYTLIVFVVTFIKYHTKRMEMCSISMLKVYLLFFKILHKKFLMFYGHDCQMHIKKTLLLLCFVVLVLDRRFCCLRTFLNKFRLRFHNYSKQLLDFDGFDVKFINTF